MSGTRSISRDRDGPSSSSRHSSRRSRSRSPRRDDRRSRRRSPSRSRSRSRSREERRRARKSSGWDVTAPPPEVNPAAVAVPMPQPGQPLTLAQQQMAAYQQQLAAQQALFSGRALGGASLGSLGGMGGGGGGAANTRQAKSLRPTRVYVGSIGYDVTEGQIREIFSIFGPIIEFEMPMDAATGRHKGFVFIEYQTSEQAQRAINECNGKSLWGRNIKVNRPGEPNIPPQNQNNMMMHNQSPAQNEALAALQARMAGGGAGAGGMYLPPSSSGGGSSSAAASNANLAQRIYVGNLTYDLTAEHIKQVFSSFGPIREVTLQMDRDTNRPKGYAFLTFENPQHAVDAIASMNNFELCGRKLRVNSATPQGTQNPGQIGTAHVGAASAAGNQQAVQHAQLAAVLLQNAGVGGGSGGGGAPHMGGGLETEGFLSSNAQRAALMEKLARGALGPLNPPMGGAAALPPSESSPVVLLLNMVAPGEVDDELETETRDECSQYGAIKKVVVHETSTQVLIFLQYTNNADAIKARQQLHARIFAGRVIRALAYPLDKFEQGIYTAEP